MKSFILASALLCFSSVHGATWNVNDVSILFDLPKSTEELSYMIGAENLIPTTIHDMMKPLVMGINDVPKDEYKSLRVIGARLDPCFKYATSTKCFPQLRLVWQPVDKDKSGEYTTFDAGVHSFYELSPTQWTSITLKMQALKTKMEKLGASTNKAPLSVHPALKNPATRAVFMKDMKAIVAEFATKKNLSRATFMRLFTPSIWWVFGGMTIKKDVVKMHLPRNNAKEEVQNFFNDDFNEPMGIKGSIVPEIVNPSQEDDLTKLLLGYSYTFATTDGQAYVKKSMETLDRIENPNHFTPETMDCVHCHVAQATRAFLKNKDKNYYQKIQATAYKYKGENLANTSASVNNPKSMRIFGYLGKATAIGQRVINESAEVARQLSL